MAHRLFLLRELVKRDFEARYAGSALGLAWSFVQPLWSLALYYFVFGTVLRLSPLGTRTESFGFFLFAGLLPWLAFHEGALRSATAVTDNANLVKKLRFPSEILVVTVTLAALAHAMLAGLVFLIILAVSGELDPTGLPLLLIAVPLQVAFTLGLGLLLAALTVFFRDVTQMVGMIFQGWFFLTPIVYPLDQVPRWVRAYIEVNPLTALVGLYRHAFFEGKLTLVPGTASLAALSVLTLLLGILVFRRLRPAFVDAI
jgi:lipopolysaccharide transport system permease protein